MIGVASRGEGTQYEGQRGEGERGQWGEEKCENFQKIKKSLFSTFQDVGNILWKKSFSFENFWTYGFFLAKKSSMSTDFEVMPNELRVTQNCSVNGFRHRVFLSTDDARHRRQWWTDVQGTRGRNWPGH